MSENYAAADIVFLDRAKQRSTAMTYPVTQIRLRERDNPERYRKFIVDVDGTWVEVSE